MIVSYRDKRTRDFAAGKWVKALSGIERSARLKPDRLESATALEDLAALPGNRFEALVGDRKGRTASASTINGGSASSGLSDQRGHRTPKLSITTKENAVALIAIHPGEHLAEELKELDMSAAELARKIGVPTNRITGILNGQRAITGDTALRLARFFGTRAEFWLNLQSLYELRLAREKAGKSIDALPTLKRPVRVHA
jgi:addiction module HigA family antidote